MQIYLPTYYEDVSASKPSHPENTVYRVTWSVEHWANRATPVLKVQMVYDGQVAGRRCPSYPKDTSDAERVMAVMQRMLQDWKRAN